MAVISYKEVADQVFDVQSYHSFLPATAIEQLLNTYLNPPFEAIMLLPTYFTLTTDAKIPAVGFGDWQAKPGEVERTVETALKAGCHHTDCAATYRNEAPLTTSWSMSSDVEWGWIADNLATWAFQRGTVVLLKTVTLHMIKCNLKAKELRKVRFRS